MNKLGIAIAIAAIAGLGLGLVATGAGAQSSDRDCSDFPNQASAQSFFLASGGPSSDPHGLDADNDGVACESNPCPCNYSTSPTSPAPAATTTTTTSTTTAPTTTTTTATAVPPPELVVDRVIDGDTIDLSSDGTVVTVRLIGIDTPETVSPGDPVECGGPQATRSLKQVAKPGDVVKAVADPTQDDQDFFGRLLRYVEERGVDYGERQIKAGWATPYVFESAFQRLGLYKAAKRKAKRGERGVWRRCDGKFHAPR